MRTVYLEFFGIGFEFTVSHIEVGRDYGTRCPPEPGEIALDRKVTVQFDCSNRHELSLENVYGWFAVTAQCTERQAREQIETKAYEQAINDMMEDNE